MILLISGQNRHGDDPNYGQFLCPRSRNRITAPRWAADNAAFSKFDARAYLKMVEEIAAWQKPSCPTIDGPMPTRPIFVAVPDVVGDAFQTRWRFCDWYPVLKRFNLPLAYVLQDGERAINVPWSHIAAVFVGGSTRFKVGPVARDLMAEAKTRGRWVHMGRLSGHKRLVYAQQLGTVDSVDGSGFARWHDAMLPRFTRVNDHPTLGLT